LATLIVKYFTVIGTRQYLGGALMPGTERLLRILRILEGAERTYTSAELEALTGWPGHTIRKDISSLGTLLELGEKPLGGKPASGRPSGAGTNAGYDPRRLVPRIKEALGLDRRHTFCVVGLGRLGSAYLNLEPASLGEFELAAGFDTNVNRVEILKSPVPLYPAHKMGEVISRLGIEIALLCVPAEAAQRAADKLAAAGIRGIVNFAPAVITVPPGIEVRNVYVRDELQALSVKIFGLRRVK
jgi:redox-sensing transcriptional repressor